MRRSDIDTGNTLFAHMFPVPGADAADRARERPGRGQPEASISQSAGAVTDTDRSLSRV
jgi:hypothetical protein